MSERIFSDLYDTVIQSEQLVKTFENEKSRLSKFYIDFFKLQIMFLGKVIITDAQFYDGTFLHGLRDDELEEFCKFVSKYSVLEIRSRNKHIISMLSKPFLFSSIQNKDLRTAILEAGKNISPLDFNNNSINEFIRLLKNEGNIDFKSVEFCEFESRLCKLDEWGNKLNLFKIWGSIEGIQAKKRGFNGLPDVINLYREGWIRYVDENIKSKKIVDELLKDFPNRSIIKDECDSAVNSEKANKFYNDFRFYYNLGIASQHFCSMVDSAFFEGFYISNPVDRDNGIGLPMEKQELNKLLELDWSDFSRIYELNSLGNERDKLWDAINNKNRLEFNIALRKICKQLKLQFETTEMDLGHSEGILTSGTDVSMACESKYKVQSGVQDITLIKFYI